MFYTHLEGKSVITERVMIANLILVFWINQYNSTHHHSINKKHISVDYSTLTDKIESNPKTRQFKVNGRVRITKYKNIFSEGYIQNWS